MYRTYRACIAVVFTSGYVSCMYRACIAVCWRWIHLGYMRETCIEGKQTLHRGKTDPHPEMFIMTFCFTGCVTQVHLDNAHFC